MKDFTKYNRIWRNGAEVNQISAVIDNYPSSIWHSSYEGRRQDLFSHAFIFNEPSATVFSGRYDLLTGDATSGLGSLSGLNVFSTQGGNHRIAYISPSN